MGATKIPSESMNACGMRDGLSGDMLASSWRNLSLFYLELWDVTSIYRNHGLGIL